jgi:Tfp pilus assembly PilM family ATPase
MPSLLVLDITDLDAKILQLSSSRKRELRLEAALRVSFEDLERSEQSLPARTQRLLMNVRRIANRAGQTVLIVPKQYVTLRNTVLPTQDTEELSSMVYFEAEKMIPFNVERHTISYAVLHSPELQGTEVMIGAIDEPIITEWMAHTKPLKTELESVEVSSLALAQTLKARQSQGLPTVYAILQIGLSNTDVVIMRGENVLLARSIRVALVNLLKAVDSSYTFEVASQTAFSELMSTNPDFAKAVDQWFTKLLSNFQKSIEFAARESQIPIISTVFVSGEAFAWEGFHSAFAQRMGFDCPLLNPLETVERDPKALVDSGSLVAFAACFGAAHRALSEDEAESINLTPYAILQEQKAAELKIHYAITGAMVVLLLLAGYFFYASQQQYKTEEAERLETYTEELDLIVEQLEDREKRIDIIRGIRSEQAGALAILGHISDYGKLGSNTLDTGNRLSLTQFEYRLGDKVRLEGFALEVEDITDFVRYLSGLKEDERPIFTNVEIQSQNPTNLPRREQRVYQFQLNLPLNVK